MELQKDKVLTQIVIDLSRKFNVDQKIVEHVFLSQFEFTRKKVEEYDLKKCETEEEFKKIKKNFFFPRLFKLYASWNQKKRLENFKLNERWKKK